MGEYKPQLKHIIKSGELRETEKSSFNGCSKCDNGYIEDGVMCNCLKHEITLRRLKNANIDYDYASLELIEDEIDAYLEDKEHPEGKFKININLFIQDYVENSENYYNDGKGIIFCGPVGRGKSLSAMKTLMYLSNKGYSCYFITVKEFLGVIKKSWKDEKYEELLHKIYNADFVVFDDLGVELHKTEWTITELDGFFRHRYFKKLVTIITTNSPLKSLKQKYAQRIISLFQERSLIVPIVSKEDYRPKLSKLPNYINRNKFAKDGDK